MNSIRNIIIVYLTLLYPVYGFSQEFTKVDQFYSFDKFGIAASYITGLQSNWIAADIEVSSIFPVEVKKYPYKGKMKKSIRVSGGSQAFGQLGAEYNIENKSLGLRLGIYQRISIFSINPVQFVFTSGKYVRGWSYRPEAGFGFWRFQLNYGYNINFNNDELNNMGKHLFILRAHF